MIILRLLNVSTSKINNAQSLIFVKGNRCEETFSYT